LALIFTRKLRAEIDHRFEFGMIDIAGMMALPAATSLWTNIRCYLGLNALRKAFENAGSFQVSSFQFSVKHCHMVASSNHCVCCPLPNPQSATAIRNFHVLPYGDEFHLRRD